MKKQILSIAISLAALFTATAQSEAQELFHRHSAGDGVIALSLPKFLLDAMDLDFDIDLKEQLRQVEGQVEKVQLLIFSKESQAEKRVALLHDDLLKLKLEEIEIDRSGNEEKFSLLRLYGQRNGSHYENLYLLMASNDGSMAMFAVLSGKIKMTAEL